MEQSWNIKQAEPNQPLHMAYARATRQVILCVFPTEGELQEKTTYEILRNKDVAVMYPLVRHGSYRPAPVITVVAYPALSS